MTYDPVPDLAALIGGVHDLAGANAADGLAILGRLLAGPYARLRGGLLLDEPGREDLRTGQALREALAEAAKRGARAAAAVSGRVPARTASHHRRTGDTTMTIANPRVTDLETGRGPTEYTDDYLILEAVHAARDGRRTRVIEHGTAVAMITPADHEPGPETLRATACGDSVAAIQARALEQARELYGPAAELDITHTGCIYTAQSGQPGRKFLATVTVRCTGLERQA